MTCPRFARSTRRSKGYLRSAVKPARIWLDWLLQLLQFSQHLGERRELGGTGAGPCGRQTVRTGLRRLVGRVVAQDVQHVLAGYI